MRTQLARPWTLEDVREILAGSVEPAEVQERIRTPDRKGLSPVTFAAMRTAATTEALLPLLELLEPPSTEENSKIGLVLDLLERIAEGQIALARRMGALESMIAGRNASLPTGSPIATVKPASGL